MNDRTYLPPVSRSIAAVERDTGLSKDTLRVWERRYGFPQPARDGFGERLYPIDQVDKLRVLRRLIDAGYRPGRIVGLPIERLHALAAEKVAALAPPRSHHDAHAEQDEFGRYLALIKAHEVDALRRALSEAQLRMGIERFVTGLAAPLTRLVGEAWARGGLEVFEEHLYTESMQVVLRGAIGTIPQPARRPRVLLTTIPQEPHGLGLLMAESILALEGCHCVSLGVQTPVWDIALAAQAHRADVVALSFSGVVNPNQVLEGLVELRAKLPPPTEIWAGGSCPVLHRRPPAGVRVMSELRDVQPALARWRAGHNGD